MAIVASLDLDSLTADQNIITANLPTNWWAFDGGNVLFTRSAAAIHGTLGARAEAAAGTSMIQYRYASVSTADACQSYYWRLVDNPGNTYIGALNEASTARADWRVNSDGTVSIRDGNTAVATSTATLSLATTYRSEWLTTSSGQELRIYEGESATPVITLTGALTNNSHDRINTGVLSGASGRTFEFDTIKIADTWTGPHNPAPPSGGIWHLVTGSGTSRQLKNPVIV